MAEIDTVIANGTVSEVATVLERLQGLPEYARSRLDERAADLLKEVVRLEDQLARARALLREQSARVLETARRNWTKEEIEEGTGYSA